MGHIFTIRPVAKHSTVDCKRSEIDAKIIQNFNLIHLASNSTNA